MSTNLLNKTLFLERYEFTGNYLRETCPLPGHGKKGVRGAVFSLSSSRPARKEASLRNPKIAKLPAFFVSLGQIDITAARGSRIADRGLVRSGPRFGSVYSCAAVIRFDRFKGGGPRPVLLRRICPGDAVQNEKKHATRG